MTVERLLARGRVAAERLMTDACVIRRKTGETTDDFSGVVTPTYTQVYAGKCRVQRVAAASSRESGEALHLVQRIELQLPASAPEPLPGDEAAMTASADAELVDRVLIVRDLAHKTHATMRRLGVEERTR